MNLIESYKQHNVFNLHVKFSLKNVFGEMNFRDKCFRGKTGFIGVYPLKP